jgi:hypothetical protein
MNSDPNNHYTQQECRQEFYKTCRDFVDQLHRIDQVTPGQPTEEPKWWVDMMALTRQLRPYADKYK